MATGRAIAGAALCGIFVSGCGEASAPPIDVAAAPSPSPTLSPSPSPGCTTFAANHASGPPAAGGIGRGEMVPFTTVSDEKIDSTSETRWKMVSVDAEHPVTIGVVLGHDLGMHVDAVRFLVKPYSYRDGDDGLAGAPWYVTAAQDIPADGQHLSTKFEGLDNSGSPLPKAVYKVMVELTGHRTSMSTCTEHGDVDPQFSAGSGETGAIYGLASIDGAPRPPGS